MLAATLLIAMIAGGDAARFGSKSVASCPGVHLRNGKIKYRQKTGFVQFQCNRSFLLAGEKYMKCVQGKWENEIPKCVKNTCAKAKEPTNGFVYPSHRGAVLNFFCKAGYDLHGPSISYCEDNKWSSHLPSCISSERQPSLNCDFEQEDLCGWSHDINHDFDWTRMQLSTPSGHMGTGPSRDHTPGKKGTGYYMYIEASSRNANDTARLISPTYPKQENSSTCVEFYYHMFGATVGELRVYMKKVREGWQLSPEDAIVWRHGNLGDRWLRGFVNLGAIDDDFQIIMEGVRGGFLSDIAIDDVRIIENCTEVEPPEDQEESTTDWSHTTEDLYEFESCANSCGHIGHDKQCDCDGSCLVRNSCCPDYIAVCILDDNSYENYTGTDESITEITDSTTEETTIETTELIPTTKFVATTKLIVAPKVTAKISPKTTLAKTTKRPKVTTKFTTISTTLATTKPKITTTKPKIATTKTKMMTAKPMTTTRKIATTKRKIAITSTVNPKIETTKFLKPKIVTKSHENDVYKNDVTTVPSETFIPVATENLKLFLPAATPVNHKSSWVLIVSCSLALLGCSLVSFCVVKRRSRCGRLRNIRGNSYGDSASDVRFLTSDEILDFTLATPDY